MRSSRTGALEDKKQDHIHTHTLLDERLRRLWSVGSLKRLILDGEQYLRIGTDKCEDDKNEPGGNHF